VASLSITLVLNWVCAVVFYKVVLFYKSKVVQVSIHLSFHRLHRLHAEHRCGLLLQMSQVVYVSVCIQFGHTGKLFKFGWADRDAIWGAAESCGFKEAGQVACVWLEPVAYVSCFSHADGQCGRWEKYTIVWLIMFLVTFLLKMSTSGDVCQSYSKRVVGLFETQCST